MKGMLQRLEEQISGMMSRRWVPEVMLALLTLTVFSLALRNGFIDAYDDELYVTMNPWVKRGVTLEGIRWAMTAYVAGNWHPLALLSHMLDVQLFGMEPVGHHLVSLFLHTGSVLLVYLLFAKLGISRSVAWCAALLFAVHPQRVQSVVWIAERKDVLSVFFGLAAIHAYLWYLCARSVKRYLLPLALFALSLLSKPMMVTLPLLLLCMDHFLLKRTVDGGWRPVLKEKLPFLLLSLGIARVTAMAQGSELTAMAVPLSSALAVAIAACAEYLRMFPLPFGLSFHYPLDTTMVGLGRVLGGLMLLAGITFVLVRLRDNRLALFGWLWFAVTILPVSGIIRFGGQFVADRYTYFPHIGLLIVVAVLVERVREGSGAASRFWPAAFVLVTVMFSVLTVREIGYWRNGETLYRRAIALNPSNWVAFNNLGTLCLRKNRYGEAFLYQSRALLLRGRPVEAMETLQFAYREGGVPGNELEVLRDQIMSALQQGRSGGR